ncbi:MAG: GxxExxY protein [Phycisphaerae bacterium]
MIEAADARTFAIIGAAMEVHREMGCGFLERVYQESLAVELATRKIPFQREIELPVKYKGQPLDAIYKPDFICYESVIVETKALSLITGLEAAQLLNYLKITGYKVGLLINFGVTSLEYERYAR